MEKKYTVTFIDGIDKSIINILYVEAGSDAIEPIPKTHKNKIFVGWDKSFYVVSENIDIESKYEDSYEVTFIDSFNDHIITKQNVRAGYKAIAPEIPTHMTYVGILWDKDISSVTYNMTVRPIYIDVSKMLKDVIGHYTVLNLKDIVAVQNSLNNIFTWIPGERILLPEFGSELRKLLYEGITLFNIERIITEIHHCISEWEPRVTINKIINIGTIDDTEDNTVHLLILYSILGLSNELFVYDLNYNKG